MPRKLKRFFTSPEIRLFGALVLVLGVFLFIALVAESERSKPAAQPAPVVDPFKGIVLTAKAAYVYDLRDKAVLYRNNERERLPLASLTKVMSALVATENATPNQSITITRESIETDGDSGLIVGEKWHLKDLLDFSLISSSNDGIHAIALAFGEQGFIARMNQTADRLGMKDTYYLNETGLDLDATHAGAYGSAKDMTTLLGYVVSKYPDLLEATEDPALTLRSDTREHTAINTDILTDTIPGLKASKTGYTDLAGGNLMIVFDPELGHPIAIALLGSTEAGRFSDMKILVERTLEKLSTDGAENAH